MMNTAAAGRFSTRFEPRFSDAAGTRPCRGCRGGRGPRAARRVREPAARSAAGRRHHQLRQRRLRAPPLCSAGCQATCGCCSCTPGERNGDLVCTSAGCYAPRSSLMPEPMPAPMRGAIVCSLPFEVGSVRCGHPGLRVRQRRVRRCGPTAAARATATGSRRSRSAWRRARAGRFRTAAPPGRIAQGDLPRVRSRGRLLEITDGVRARRATPMRARLLARWRFPSAPKASASTPSVD